MSAPRQTVYFYNPTTIANLQAQVSPTNINVGNSTLSGSVTISNPQGSTIITDLEGQVDQMLITRNLQTFAPLFRVIPHINSDSTLWFDTTDNWEIMTGPLGEPDAGGIPIQYDTDVDFEWVGQNNAGTTSVFDMTLHIPSLNTGTIPFNVYGYSGSVDEYFIVGTGATGAVYGPMQTVTFKYKGQGQDANQPLIQGDQQVCITIPPNWFTTGTHNLIMGFPGSAETSPEVLEQTYVFPPYNTSIWGPDQNDNRAYASPALSTAYDLNFNSIPGKILGSPSNPTSWISIVVPTDSLDVGFNPFEENGEFRSFLYEWIIAQGNKTINQTYFSLESAGGLQNAGDPFNNFFWKGIRIPLYGCVFNAAPMWVRPKGSIEDLYYENRFGSFGLSPDSRYWAPSFPKVSTLHVIGQNDPFFGVPGLFRAGLESPTFPYPWRIQYSTQTTAKFFREKFGLNPISDNTGAVYSNTGVYYGLTSITEMTGANYQLKPYAITNPLKYNGEDEWNVPGINTFVDYTNPFTTNTLTQPQNPINVYSVVVPNDYHPVGSAWASGYAPGDAYLPYGYDWMTLWLDFVNKTL